jgi:hypothetical protein
MGEAAEEAKEGGRMDVNVVVHLDDELTPRKRGGGGGGGGGGEGGELGREGGRK